MPIFCIYYTIDFTFSITYNARPLPTSEKENKYLLALNAYYNGQFQTIYAAATAYNVNHKTLMARSKGQSLHVICPPNGHKFTIMEGKTLEDWILSLDARGLPFYIQMASYIANLLLASRGIAPIYGRLKLGYKLYQLT